MNTSQNFRFRNLAPLLNDLGEVVDAEFTDVTIAETLLLSWQDVVQFSPQHVYRAIRSAALAEARSALVDVQRPYVGPVAR